MNAKQKVRSEGRRCMGAKVRGDRLTLSISRTLRFSNCSLHDPKPIETGCSVEVQRHFRRRRRVCAGSERSKHWRSPLHHKPNIHCVHLAHSLRHTKHDVDHASICSPTFNQPRKRKIGLFHARINVVNRSRAASGNRCTPTKSRPMRVWDVLHCSRFEILSAMR